jgi:hypothetical protein
MGAILFGHGAKPIGPWYEASLAMARKELAHGHLRGRFGPFAAWAARGSVVCVRPKNPPRRGVAATSLKKLWNLKSKILKIALRRKVDFDIIPLLCGLFF